MKMAKINTLITLRNRCMENHLCGNYIHIKGQDVEWGIDLEKLGLCAFTDFGTYFFEYDFDCDFDTNLQAFYEELVDFLEAEDVVY